MSTPQIPILDLKPQVEGLWEELNGAFQRVLRGTHFIMGPEVKAFEQEVAEHLGVKHAVGVNSGTDALFIALRALGVGPGDEVITTPFTFFATAEAISHVGATPVFVDIDPATYDLDPALVEEAVTPRTKAIIPVHLFGRPCAMASLMHVAKAHGLAVVEDCAQSFGARYMGLRQEEPELLDEALRVQLVGRQTGTIGHFGCYSFFPSKNLGAYGDGGLVVTDSDELASAARMLRVHGSRKKYYNETVGYNSRLDEMQAAILRVKLPHLETWNDGRRRVARRYRELLSGHEGIEVPEVTPGHVFHQYTVRLKGADRDQVQQRMKEAGVDTMVYYPVPCHKLKLYQESHAGTSCPHAEAAAAEVLSLPIWPELEEADQARVAQALLAAAGAKREAPVTVPVTATAELAGV